MDPTEPGNADPADPPPPENGATFLTDTLAYIDRAAAHLTQYPPGLIEQIRECNVVARFRFPLLPDGAARHSGKAGVPHTPCRGACGSRP